MASIWIDANYFIDFAELRSDVRIADFDGHILWLSPLSVHILCYAYKYPMPDSAPIGLLEGFHLQPFDENVLHQSMLGPTTDLDDNIQLHSAIRAEADYFLTNDRKLLKLGYFGEMEIVSSVKEVG